VGVRPTFAAEGIAVAITRPRWKAVARVTAGTHLPKRRAGASKDALLSARSISTRFGCYSWATSAEVLYCGSYSQDYKTAGCRSNLEGRLHQYLCNHKRDRAGHPKNTNATVYDRLVQTLRSTDALFQVLEFDGVSIDKRAIDFPTCSSDPYLVRAVERLLIWFYRRRGECEWNHR